MCAGAIDSSVFEAQPVEISRSGAPSMLWMMDEQDRWDIKLAQLVFGFRGIYAEVGAWEQSIIVLFPVKVIQFAVTLEG